MNFEKILFAIEITGTIAFAITGVITAVEKKLDILGAIVLGTVTAVGGGILRDIMLGYLPPMAFRNPVYALTAIATSVVVFVIAFLVGKKIVKHFEVYSQVINFFDSLGLAVFVVTGVNTAAACGFGENAFLSIFVAVLTGVGGGVMRDILAGRVPKILRRRVYALAAILGAIIYYYLLEFNVFPQTVSMLIGAGSVLIIRILATIFHWNLPTIKNIEE
ncbi:MAG: trimeric intracellular cation channel family protein [Clostridia bacterium]|nr:trimeric intracellular cation channel family protein [Clostridia bacterium]